MPQYQAPNHVHSVSAAGVEYSVENGQIEAPLEILPLIAPLGFILLNEDQLKAAAIAEAEAQRLVEAEKLALVEEQRKADELAKAELAAQKKAEADTKKQAAAEEKRLKAEADAKAAAAAEVAKNTPPANQE